MLGGVVRLSRGWVSGMLQGVKEWGAGWIRMSQGGMRPIFWDKTEKKWRLNLLTRRDRDETV